MTFRTAALMLVIVMAATPFTRADDDDDMPSLRANKKLEGDLVGERKTTEWPGYVDSYYGYMTEVPVALKAGRKITISGAVVGKNRKIAIALRDPSGKIIAATKRDTEVSSARLVVAEVNATGKYKIQLVSDQIGAFSVMANFTEDDEKKNLEETVARLKKEIARLSKELADAEAQLTEVREKNHK